MKKLSKLQVVPVFIVFAAFFIQAQFAYAEVVIRSGETVSVAEDQTITGDFYSAASVTSISGEITEDLIIASGKVTLNGVVGSDALLLGGTVDVHGSVGDDLRIIGGEVVIAEPVTGDVFVIGGKVNVLSTASVGGDLIVYGGDVVISGPVKGNVVGRINSLRLDGEVSGNVDVSTLTFVLGDRANITGSVSYESIEQLTRAQGAVVEGDVVRSDPVDKKSVAHPRTIVISILALLFAVLVWFMVAKQWLNKIAERALVSSYRPGLLGLALVLIMPFIIIILLVSILGTLVGIASLFGYLLAITLAILSMSAVLGKLIMRTMKKEETYLSPITLLVGVSGIAVIALVPIVGIFILFGLFIVSLGAIADLLLRPKIE